MLVYFSETLHLILRGAPHGEARDAQEEVEARQVHLAAKRMQANKNGNDTVIITHSNN